MKAHSATARLVGSVSPSPDRTEQLAARTIIQCPVNAKGLRYLKLVAQPYRRVPEGYPGAGGAAWMFVDELILK